MFSVEELHKNNPLVRAEMPPAVEAMSRQVSAAFFKTVLPLLPSRYSFRVVDAPVNAVYFDRSKGQTVDADTADADARHRAFDEESPIIQRSIMVEGWKVSTSPSGAPEALLKAWRGLVSRLAVTHPTGDILVGWYWGWLQYDAMSFRSRLWLFHTPSCTTLQVNP